MKGRNWQKAAIQVVSAYNGEGSKAVMQPRESSHSDRRAFCFSVEVYRYATHGTNWQCDVACPCGPTNYGQEYQPIGLQSACIAKQLRRPGPYADLLPQSNSAKTGIDPSQLITDIS